MPAATILKKDGTPRKARAPRVKKEEVEEKKSILSKSETSPEVVEESDSLLDKYVFMDKSLSLLEIGLKTETNIVLYGPGGHGKSELALEFLYEKGINPYVITMGKGMTTDRLFGGIDLPILEKEGKLEYLVDNSFMNHEYVIFEELMDAPDYILEQLKDILSSGYFRNGTQVYKLKTRFIIGNTNKTREEFSTNDSLKALMERFPLELNVIWPNYNEISYNTLLERRFGEGRVDPIIPFILDEFVKNGVTISPRIALKAYEIYETCGPDSLPFIADFAKKPELITSGLKKFKSSNTFREIAESSKNLIKEFATIRAVASTNNTASLGNYIDKYNEIEKALKTIKGLTVSDSLSVTHAAVIKSLNDTTATYKSTYQTCIEEYNKAQSV